MSILYALSQPFNDQGKGRPMKNMDIRHLLRHPSQWLFYKHLFHYSELGKKNQNPTDDSADHHAGRNSITSTQERYYSACCCCIALGVGTSECGWRVHSGCANSCCGCRGRNARWASGSKAYNRRTPSSRLRNKLDLRYRYGTRNNCDCRRRRDSRASTGSICVRARHSDSLQDLNRRHRDATCRN